MQGSKVCKIVEDAIKNTVFELLEVMLTEVLPALKKYS